MNERLQALLDDAVSDLQPADPDPVPALIARGRAARRRTVVAVALATVLLAGFAVAGARAIDRPVPVVPAAAQPPTPRVVGGTVVAGDVVVPIPHGWRVVAGSPKAPCGWLKDTVLIYGPGVQRCQYAPLMVGTTADGYVSGIAVGTGTTMAVSPPTPYTLRGGAPAWLAVPVTDKSNDPGNNSESSYSNTLVVPWSKVVVMLGVPGPRQQQIIDSISVTPSPRAGRLLLQDGASEATLIRPRAGGADPDYGELHDPGRIKAVMRLLRAQHETVDARHACTSPGSPTARLALDSMDPVRPSGSPATPSTNGQSNLVRLRETTVIVSLGDCREAVSSNGGRVRLSQAAVDELARLFGIATR